METNDMTRLNLLGDSATASGGGCCGGGACGCGHGAAEAPATADATAAVDAHEYLVTGMTCGHCVASVKEEVGAVDGVQAVEVALVKGGASRVTVQSAGPIDEAKIRAAVEEAGYQLA
ncbi:heavy-metal-associated domain-containing protein [Yonghaparkia sp. Soil809]|uniref:heavy-metal-associated domain-containing protein n=1 Tax=Yonghaparkia sp. Soil809 TaxID=1736417 RepID=UPI001F2DFACC|nr:heavy-metal-associated domain-containing protein [Yonghaparkia sp. Soil809]